MAIIIIPSTDHQQDLHLPAPIPQKTITHDIYAHATQSGAHDDGSRTAEYKPVPDFPLDVLPRKLQYLVLSAACIYNVSIAVAAIGLLALTMAYLGRSRCLLNIPHQTLANMWLVHVGRSGTGKSNLIDKLFELFQIARPGMDDDTSVRLPAFATDVSYAGVLDDLQDNAIGMVVRADEICDWMNRRRAEKSLANLATIYDNRSVRKVRSRNAECDAFIYNPYMSLLGGIQPMNLPTLFTPADITAGYAARFNLIFCEDNRRTWQNYANVDKASLQENLDALLIWFHTRMLHMHEASYTDGFFHPCNIRLTTEAEAVVKVWESKNDEKREQWRNTPMETVLAKLPRQTMSAMLNLYALETCASDAPETFRIDEDIAQRGIQLSDWLLANQRYCWNLLDPHLKIEYSPVHSAIARAIVEHPEIPIQNKNVFPMSKLVELTNEYLPFPETPNKIGMVANALGLERWKSRTERGRVIKKSTLAKMAFILETTPRTPDDDLLVTED